MGHELARLFDYDHLPLHLQEIVKPFAKMANLYFYEDPWQSNPELQHEIIWKLWEAKNLAVVTVAQFGNQND